MFNCPQCHGSGYTDSEGYNECRAEGCTAHDTRIKFERQMREHKLDQPFGHGRDWLICRLVMMMEREAQHDLLMVQRRLGVPDSADATAGILDAIDKLASENIKLRIEKRAAEQRAYQLSEDLVNAARPRQPVGVGDGNTFTVHFPLPVIKKYPPFVMQPKPQCAKCHITLTDVMAYSCQHVDCPCGLGPLTV